MMYLFEMKVIWLGKIDVQLYFDGENCCFYFFGQLNKKAAEKDFENYLESLLGEDILDYEML